MCSNYEPIAKDRIHLLDLFEPTFEYKSHIYPNYEAPLLFSKKEEKECLMQVMDGIHSKFGKKKLGVGPCFVPGRN